MKMFRNLYFSPGIVRFIESNRIRLVKQQCIGEAYQVRMLKNLMQSRILHVTQLSKKVNFVNQCILHVCLPLVTFEYIY